MKNFFIATIVALFSFIVTNACEICGCGTGNYYIGFIPQFQHKFIGIRYSFQNFHTRLNDDPAQFSRDYYQTAEVWAGLNFGKRWQVLALVPYHFIHQVSDDGISNSKGIGDIAVIANYKILDKSTGEKGHMVSQQLWLGAGIKLPTGKFNIDAADPELIAIANTQTGTGSTDFMMNAAYNIRINKVGINTNASYKMNTSNNDKFTFGNKFSASSFVYYVIDKFKTGITPNIGLMYENTGTSGVVSQKLEQTGGFLATASAGVELSFKKISVGFNAQLPVAQNFAGKQTELKARGMAHITFSF